MAFVLNVLAVMLGVFLYDLLTGKEKAASVDSPKPSA